MPDVHAVLDRWFGDWTDERPLPDGLGASPQLALWWGADPAVDADLRVRFTGEHLAAAAGALDEQAARDPQAAIARILLLDQLPRNLYRGTPHAFATDGRAQRACVELLARTEWEIPPIHHYFALMPLMHAESVALQDRSVREFTRLAATTAGLARASTYASAVEFAERHRAIVLRFGRFPHRNQILGRTSTPEELQFLTTPGSSF